MRSKNAIKNVITSLIIQIITIICGFIIPKIIIQNYGSATNGLINSINQFLSYITLLEAGFGPVVKAILYKPIAQKDKTQIEEILKSAQKFFRIIAYIFIIYIVVLICIFPILVNREFGYLYTASLVAIISISTFFEYFFGITYRIYLQAEQKTYIVSYIQIVTTVINTILVIILVKLGLSIQLVKFGTAFVYTLRPILQNLYVKKKYNIKLNQNVKTIDIKQKWDGFAQHIATVIHRNTDIVVLTFFSTQKEISVYAIYMLIINNIKNVLDAMNSGISASLGDMIAKNEQENLKNKFSIYELLFYTTTTIVFICTLILIVPFVEVYTKGITDNNYIRPTFAFFMTLAEYIWAIRLPYNTITLSAGHFKETKNGAWVEAFTNIVISVILVFKYGIIGVAIGTMVAMIIRTIEFMFYSSKNILKRDVKVTFGRLIPIIIEFIIMILVSSKIKVNYMNTYIDWTIYAIKIFALTNVVVLTINTLMYKKEMQQLINFLKEKIKAR